MSERDSTLDPASTRTRDDEEISDNSGELQRARRLLRRNEAVLEQIKERQKKANDGDGGSNQSNDAQMMRRERVNHSQQSRDAGTHRTVGDMEYRRAERTLKKSRQILRRIRDARDADGEQNNYDQEEGGNEENSEYSGYSKRTYNSNIWNQIYPSRESRKSRRERQFSRDDDRSERDHRDQRGASHRRRENGSGGRGLPAGYFDPGNDRRRRDVPADPDAAEEPPSPAGEPRRAEPGPVPRTIPEDSEIVHVPEGGRKASEFVPPIENLLHPDMINWGFVQYRVVNMMNREAPIFLEFESKAKLAMRKNEIDGVRNYGAILKPLAKEMIYMFSDCLRGHAPGIRETLLKDFGRFIEQYTFDGYERLQQYPGGRWIFFTREEFERIKDQIRPPAPPPSSSGNDGGSSGGVVLPAGSDRDRSGRNYDEGGPAAARRGGAGPSAMIFGRTHRTTNPEREARFKQEQAKQMKEFEQGFRRNSEPTEAAEPAPAPGPPAADGGGRDFASAVVPGGEIVPASDADGADSRAGVEPVYERAKVFSLSDLDDSDSEDGSGGGRILDGARPRLVPAPDKIIFEKGDSGENQGYASLPDDGAPQQAKSSGWLDPLRWAAKMVRRNRETRYAGRVKNMDELEGKRRPWVWRRGTITRSRVEARLRSMGHPYYQEEELN